MADPQAQAPIPEDEQFLTDEQLVDQYLKDRHGVEPDAPPAEASEPEPAPEPQALEEGESKEREPTKDADPTPEEPAWMKDMPEEAKAAYLTNEKELASLRENYNAIHNRLAPVQQENARLRDRLASTSQRPEQPTDSAPAPVGQAPQSGINLSEVEEFKEFQDAFPDEAKALEAVFARQNQHIGHLQQQLGGVVQGLQSMQQASFASEREAELAQLSAAHPDWATVRPSEDFSEWLKAQPADIARFADSPKAEHCIWILDRYKADAFLAQQFQSNGTAAPQQAPQGDGRAQQTRQRRQQIRGVPTPPPQQDGGVGAPLAGGQPQSEEEIWEREVERRLKAQQNANR